MVVSQDCPPDFSDIWYDGSSFQGFCCSGSVWRDDSNVLVVLSLWSLPGGLDSALAAVLALLGMYSRM